MAESTIQDQIQRIQKARARCDELIREKNRLQGEQSVLVRQKLELESKCKEEFECDISELPALIESINNTSEVALSNAEIILGLREGTLSKETINTDTKKNSQVDSEEDFDPDAIA